jgi:protein-tyrosine phosphatase
MGNICRSPMAEAVFRHLANEAGLSDQIMVDSCGTGGWHAGEPAHTGTQQVLHKHGIDFDHSARKLTHSDLADADYLIAMDIDNLNGIHRLGEPHGTTALLLSYAPHLNTREVPDPYYDGRFEEVYRLVEAGCKGLLDSLRSEHAL